MKFGSGLLKSEELDLSKLCIFVILINPLMLLDILAPHHWYTPSHFPLTVARDQAIENVQYYLCFSCDMQDDIHYSKLY